VGDIERLEDYESIRELLEMRSKARHEEASRLYQAEMRGIEKGKEEGKLEVLAEVAKNAYKEGQSIEFISKITGISIEKLKQIFI
jgi:predicted transposase/invertase (TIGR01784 family)